jgi:hypothetical protein
MGFAWCLFKKFKSSSSIKQHQYNIISAVLGTATTGLEREEVK